MKLTAKQVNYLKARIEGATWAESIYNRLTWDISKRIRLSCVEKDAIEGLFTTSTSTEEDHQFARELTGREIKI